MTHSRTRSPSPVPHRPAVELNATHFQQHLINDGNLAVPSPITRRRARSPSPSTDGSEPSKRLRSRLPIPSGPAPTTELFGRITRSRSKTPNSQSRGAHDETLVPSDGRRPGRRGSRSSTKSPAPAARHVTLQTRGSSATIISVTNRPATLVVGSGIDGASSARGMRRASPRKCKPPGRK